MNFLQNWDKKFYDTTNVEQFIPWAIGLSLIGDGSYMIYLKFVIASPQHLNSWLQEYSFLPNMQLILSNPALMKELWANFQQILNLMITVMLIMNAVGYIFFFRLRKFGIKNMKSLATTGLIFNIFTLWEALDQGLFWITVMLFLFPLYFYIHRGIKYYCYPTNAH